MNKITGVSLEKSPVSNLNKVADLIYFEGPLLSWYDSASGDDYLFYWCDADAVHNRWLVFRVENGKIIDYLNQEITLLNLLSTSVDGFVFVIDVDSELNQNNVTLTTDTDLPADYKPSSNSFYEFTPTFTPSRRSLANKDKYRVNIGKQWLLNDLYEFPQKYSTLYSFIYSLRQLNNEYIPSPRIKATYQDYPWKGGFSTVNFFRDLNNDVLTQHKPQIASLHYASPGWIEIDLLVPVAHVLRDIINTSITNNDELKQYYKSTYSFLKQYKITGEAAREKDLQDNIVEIITTRYTTIAEYLGFAYVDRVVEFTKDRVITLKIMLAFYRRIRELSGYQLQGKVSL